MSPAASGVNSQEVELARMTAETSAAFPWGPSPICLLLLQASEHLNCPALFADSLCSPSFIKFRLLPEGGRGKEIFSDDNIFILCFMTSLKFLLSDK